MAQPSKKAHIVESALPLFLENGFKGTSIDLVVRASGVSKPTVYNHFPDKSALMLAVMARWIDDHKPLISVQRNLAGLDGFVRQNWLTEARTLFWEQFDRRWRKALAYVSDDAAGSGRGGIDAYLDHRLIQRLRAQ